MFIDVHTFCTHMSHVLSSSQFQTKKQNQVLSTLNVLVSALAMARRQNIPES